MVTVLVSALVETMEKVATPLELVVAAADCAEGVLPVPELVNLAVVPVATMFV